MQQEENIAVSNFLGSIDSSEDKYIHILNANDDARRYGWDKLTLLEILNGIHEIYDRKKSSRII